MEIRNKVILMDDEVILRQLLIKQLRRSGLYAVTARSPKELLRLARSDHFDAAVLDIRMSLEGEEGLRTLRELRNLKPNMYLEVITAFEEFEERAFEYGADAFFVKPKGTGISFGERIRKGILTKELSRIQEFSEIEVAGLVSANGHERFTVPWAAARVSVVRESLCALDRLLSTKRAEYGLDDGAAETLWEDMLGVLLGVITSSEVSKEKSLSDDVLASNMNVLAFETKREELLKEFLGQYVAFCGGELVAVETSKVELFDCLERVCPGKTCFVKKVQKAERVVRFRRPRIVRKS